MRNAGTSRWLLDIGAALMLVIIVIGVLFMQRSEGRQESLVEQVAANVRRMELEVKFRAASAATQLNGRGWPVTVDPNWFEEGAPRNGLVDEERPWVEVATPDHASRLHPQVRMTINHRVAAFWYNPYQGIVRARVPVMVSDAAALKMYNRVNGSRLDSIFERKDPPMPAVYQAVAPPQAGVEDQVTTVDPNQVGSP